MGGPHHHKRIPIFTGKMGIPGPYSTRKMGTRDPHFRGSPFNFDTGARKAAGASLYLPVLV